MGLARQVIALGAIVRNVVAIQQAGGGVMGDLVQFLIGVSPILFIMFGKSCRSCDS
tara:strand:- start:1188 stop:1355 length:168 start_codon:yes stop_codon:yes gene_type:complete